MSGDYSQLRFDPTKDFNGLLQQQGRVHVESDANELVRIVDRRFRAQISDTIGRCTVPRETAEGFQIALAGGKLTIGPGRIYVDGLLAENHGKAPLRFDACLAEQRGQAIGIDEQPYLANAALPAGPGPHLVYVVVHERELTALERPDLIEKAIGQDTVTALQTAWQVRVLEDIGQAITPATPDAQFPAWQKLTRPSAGRLTTSVAEAPPDPNPCSLAAGAGGYTGLENQLYRVEVQQGGPIGTATFKWSRDNASVATSVLAMRGVRIDVTSIGRDSVLRINPGDWLEVTDDFRELSGLPPELRKVVSVIAGTQTIELDSALLATDFPVNPQGQVELARHTRVRRWDQKGAAPDANGGAIPVPAAGTPVSLEHGIQVIFDLDAADGEFHAGDYWTFAARVADASVELLQKAPARGIHRHFGRLAIISFPDTVTDCRVLWPPALEKKDPVVPALHVVSLFVGDIELHNDREVGVSFLTSGIRVNFDDDPVPRDPRDDPTCFVTLELPYPLNASDVALWNDPPPPFPPPVLGFQPLRLAAQVTIKGNAMIWVASAATQEWLRKPLPNRLDQLRRELRVRAHLTLKGNLIWALRDDPDKPSTYLDGNAFGAGKNADIRLPSGDGQRGGDFELWFFLNLRG